MPFAWRSIQQEIRKKHIGLFYTCFLLCLAGLLGIVVTGDAFNLFVFLEISSLSSYVLISLGCSRRALTAAFQYLVMGTIGATFILIGVGLLYMITGTLNMADISQRLPEVADTRTIRVAFAFVTVGVSIKLALFPLHLWLPNAYTFAPSVVSAFFAATATKVGVYVLLRLFFTVFGIGFSFAAMHVGEILMLLAAAAMLVASLVAIFQNNVKRMLAYSSVAQIGYIILGISLATSDGVAAGMIQLFNHALIKCALFLSLGCIFLRLGSVELRDMHGLAQADALDHGRIRGGWPEPDRHTADGRVHQQVVPGQCRTHGRLLAAGRADPVEFVAGTDLYLARGGDRLFPGARCRDAHGKGGAGQHADTHLATDRRQLLHWS